MPGTNNNKPVLSEDLAEKIGEIDQHKLVQAVTKEYGLGAASAAKEMIQEADPEMRKALKANGGADNGLILAPEGELYGFRKNLTKEEREEFLKNRVKDGGEVYLLPNGSDTPVRLAYDELHDRIKTEPLDTELQELPPMPSFMDRVMDFFGSIFGQRNEKCVAYDKAKKHNKEVEKNRALIKSADKLAKRRDKVLQAQRAAAQEKAEKAKALATPSTEKKPELNGPSADQTKPAVTQDNPTATQTKTAVTQGKPAATQAKPETDAQKAKEKSAPVRVKRLKEQELLQTIEEKFGKDAVTDTLKNNIRQLYSGYTDAMTDVLNGFAGAENDSDTFTLGVQNAARIGAYDAVVHTLENGNTAMIKTLQRPGAAVDIQRFARFSDAAQSLGGQPKTVAEFKNNLLYSDGSTALSDDVYVTVNNLNPDLMPLNFDAPGRYAGPGSATLKQGEPASQNLGGQSVPTEEKLLQTVAEKYGLNAVTKTLVSNVHDLYSGYDKAMTDLNAGLAAAKNDSDTVALGVANVANIAALGATVAQLENDNPAMVESLQKPGAAVSIQRLARFSKPVQALGEQPRTSEDLANNLLDPMKSSELSDDVLTTVNELNPELMPMTFDTPQSYVGKTVPNQETESKTPDPAELMYRKVEAVLGTEAITPAVRENLEKLQNDFMDTIDEISDKVEIAEKDNSEFAMGAEQVGKIAAYTKVSQALDNGDIDLMKELLVPEAASKMQKAYSESEKGQEIGEIEHKASFYKKNLISLEGRSRLVGALEKTVDENGFEKSVSDDQPVLSISQPDHSVLVPQNSEESAAFDSNLDVVEYMCSEISRKFGDQTVTMEVRENIQKLYDGYMQSADDLVEKTLEADKNGTKFAFGAEKVGNLVAFGKIQKAIENDDFMAINELQTPNMAEKLQAVATVAADVQYLGQRKHDANFYRQNLATEAGLNGLIEKTDMHLDKMRIKYYGTEAIAEVKKAHEISNQNFKDAYQQKNLPLTANAKGPSDKAVYVSGNLYKEPGSSELNMVSGDSTVVKAQNAAVSQAQQNGPDQKNKGNAVVLFSPKAEKRGTMFREPGDLDWRMIPGSDPAQFRKDYKEFMHEMAQKGIEKNATKEKKLEAAKVQAKQPAKISV